jgi:hypothetical protein
MLGIKFGHMAVTFGILGIALLYVVTVLSQPVHIQNLALIANHEGEVVSVEGTILDRGITSSGDLYYTIYNAKSQLDVIIEDNTDPNNMNQINSIIKITGEVQKNYRGEYELVVTDSRSLEILGTYNPPELNWTEVEPYNNSYVKLHGTVIGLEDHYGNKQRAVIQNGNERLTCIIMDPNPDLIIGNIIEANGLIGKISREYRFYVHNIDSISIIGYWQLESVKLARLADAPEKHLSFPATVQGIVRYEPYSVPAYSFYLTDSATDPQVSIKVDLSELNELPELHKGDLVSMVAYSAFDNADARYYLVPVACDILQTHGKWQVDIDELMESPFEFERAQLNLSGYLHAIDDLYYLTDRAVYDNCSIFLDVQMDITGLINQSPLEYNSSLSLLTFNEFNESNLKSGKKLTLRGRLEYCSERFDYKFTLEPNPRIIFPGI